VVNHVARALDFAEVLFIAAGAANSGPHFLPMYFGGAVRDWQVMPVVAA
jgi:hypothetical protein